MADVPDQLDSLEKATGRLIEATKHLHSRLQPIVRPQPPQPATHEKDCVPVCVVCAVADQIRNRVTNIHEAATILESLAREIEL